MTGETEENACFTVPYILKTASPRRREALPEDALSILRQWLEDLLQGEDSVSCKLQAVQACIEWLDNMRHHNRVPTFGTDDTLDEWMQIEVDLEDCMRKDSLSHEEATP